VHEPCQLEAVAELDEHVRGAIAHARMTGLLLHACVIGWSQPSSAAG